MGPYATLLLGFMAQRSSKSSRVHAWTSAAARHGPPSQGEGLYPGGEPGERPWNRTAHYVHRNGNKRSLTLDLATARVLLQLATICDVLIENFRASVMDRLGLGHEARRSQPPTDLRQDQQPGGHGSGARLWPLGSTLEQTAGLASITGYEDGKPLMTNETYPDPVVGILAVGVLMAALRQRRQTGTGTFIDLSQREVTVAMLGEYVVDYSVTGRVPGPLGNRHPHLCRRASIPVRATIWVAISVGSDDEWRGLCRAIGQLDLAQDPRFATVLTRRHHQAELDQILTAWTQEREHYQAMHLLQARRSCRGSAYKGGETRRSASDSSGLLGCGQPSRGGNVHASLALATLQESQASHYPSPSLGEHKAMYSATSWDSRSRRSRL